MARPIWSSTCAWRPVRPDVSAVSVTASGIDAGIEAGVEAGVEAGSSVAGSVMR
jgi:hypothetical protein